MKNSIIITIIFLVAHFTCNAQIHVDSSKLVKLNDSLYGVALYGVVMPSGPCSIIDSSKYTTNDTISISLCYLYGNAASALCRGYDTILLGNLNNTSLTVIVALARTDTVNNTCTNPQKKDTIVLQYIHTGITNIENDRAVQLFPNPTNNILSGKIAQYTGVTTMQITSTTGQLMLQNVITQPNFVIDVSTLPPGMYFLSLTDGRQRAVKRFIKQ